MTYSPDESTPKSLFRLDASIRNDGSVSRAIADIVEATWRQDNPHEVVTRRHIGLEPVPSTSWALSVFSDRTQPENLSVQQKEAVQLASVLVDELLDAEAYLFAVPLYNFGVSQHFKTWVDLVITDPRLASAAGQPLRGRPAVLVVVRGGAYGEGTPREGWDHATGWMRRILEDVWGLDLRVVETEFTLVGVNPALDEFKTVAAEMRREAERLAAEHGRHLTGALTH
jgi:FMN-dependent NADH-azoreductase